MHFFPVPCKTYTHYNQLEFYSYTQGETSGGARLTLHHAEDPEEGQELGRNGRLVTVKGKDRRSENQHKNMER